MKNQINIFRILLMALVISLSATVYGQNGDPPPPPDEHGQTGNQPPGGGAAIDGGLLILAALGGAYGIRKYRRSRRKIAE